MRQDLARFIKARQFDERSERRFLTLIDALASGAGRTSVQDLAIVFDWLFDLDQYVYSVAQDVLIAQEEGNENQ